MGGTEPEAGVKAHAFWPSGRFVWTVVGRGGEHWVDPDAGYCSCPAFYFAGSCYHLDLVRAARRRGGEERFEFADDEFVPFVSGVVEDL
ncbi:MAG: hypothetical protein MPI95_06025 [Nitrosopumilus sp.]|nr:hypothetical protein [Nitrosopumilus sp.]CAI9832496.1 conserved hypothetical protein [Nitrosopumilaceae archaeon]MDA7941510.1 hypothetical protein [Nitrosopumilus sp.]MDA7943348.1 hypothetical protein [Nitrosopumilus sp.]MDA7944796.1 hypothetical protein [Nitrosopumilus sp.]